MKYHQNARITVDRRAQIAKIALVQGLGRMPIHAPAQKRLHSEHLLQLPDHPSSHRTLILDDGCLNGVSKYAS